MKQLIFQRLFKVIYLGVICINLSSGIANANTGEDTSSFPERVQDAFDRAVDQEWDTAVNVGQIAAAYDRHIRHGSPFLVRQDKNPEPDLTNITEQLDTYAVEAMINFLVQSSTRSPEYGCLSSVCSIVSNLQYMTDVLNNPKAYAFKGFELKFSPLFGVTTPNKNPAQLFRDVVVIFSARKIIGSQYDEYQPLVNFYVYRAGKKQEIPMVEAFAKIRELGKLSTWRGKGPQYAEAFDVILRDMVVNSELPKLKKAIPNYREVYYN